MRKQRVGQWFVLVMMIMGCLKSSSALEEVSMSFIQANLLQNASLSNQCSVQYHIQRQYSDAALADSQFANQCLSVEEYNCELFISGQKFRFEGDVKTFSEEDSTIGKSKIVFTCNGDSCQYYSVEHNQGVVLSPVSISHLPTPLDLGLIYAGMNMGEYLDDSQPTYCGTEIARSVPCYLISAPIMNVNEKPHGEVKIWVNPDQGWNVIQKQILDLNGEILYESDIDYMEWQSGVWFPQSGVNRVFKQNGDGATLYCTENWTIRDYASDVMFDESSFHVVFPQGTGVYDSIMELYYIVPGLEELAAVANITERKLSIDEMRSFFGAACGACQSITGCESTVCDETEAGGPSLMQMTKVNEGASKIKVESKGCRWVEVWNGSVGVCQFDHVSLKTTCLYE